MKKINTNASSEQRVFRFYGLFCLMSLLMLLFLGVLGSFRADYPSFLSENFSFDVFTLYTSYSLISYVTGGLTYLYMRSNIKSASSEEKKKKINKYFKWMFFLAIIQVPFMLLDHLNYRTDYEISIKFMAESLFFFIWVLGTLVIWIFQIDKKRR